MAKKRTGKEAEALASTPNCEKPISATKKTSKLSFRSKVKAAGSPGTNQDPLSSAVSKREMTALLAYAYWMQRGCPFGSPEEDWFRAEREMDSAQSSADPLAAHASGKDLS
jgi:cytochrome c